MAFIFDFWFFLQQSDLRNENVRKTVASKTSWLSKQGFVNKQQHSVWL